MAASTNLGLQEVLDKVREFKRKYYINLLIKGVLLGLGIIFSVFLLINSAEYFGRFNSFVRGLLLFGFIGVSAYVLYSYILRPVFYLLKINEPLDDVTAAKEIGRFFPEVKDKLLNVLQLSADNSNVSDLVDASIAQKTKGMKFINFSDAIQFDQNKKYLKYVLPPLLLILFISAISPAFFTNSTERLVKFRKDFVPEAPFQFIIKNDTLSAFKNQDFDLKVEVVGTALPEEVYVFYNNRKYKMTKSGDSTYDFTFNKLNDSFDFALNAAGFTSGEYRLNVLSPPSLLSFTINLTYPRYLNKAPEKFSNVGNVIVPEGTNITWNFSTANTDSLYLKFDNQPTPIKATEKDNTSFVAQKNVRKSAYYNIVLKNNQLANQSDIDYYINTIPDKYPVIDFTQLRDSTVFSYIALGGSISDDYGLNGFKLFYKKEQDKTYRSFDIPFNKAQTSQRFYFQFDLAKLNLNRGEKLVYYLELWDNDGVNGSKSTKSSLQTFEVPNLVDYAKDIDKQVKDTEDKFENVLKKAKDYKESVEKLDKKTKIDDKLDFQEKKDIENLLKQRNDLQNDLQQLLEEFKQLQQKQERFNEFSPQTQEKMNQLQQLMNELLKQENAELYKKLEELLRDNEEENATKTLDEIKKNERNLDRNIDRTLKLFKNLQLQQKIDDLVKDLEKLADKQDELAKESEDKSKNQNDKSKDELAKEQEQLNKEFQQEKELLKEVEKLSDELNKSIDTQEQEQNKAENSQEEAAEQLSQQQMSDAAKSQKKSAKSMRKIAEGLSMQMQSQEMKQLDIDIDALRAILENLVKLSFDQERIMKNLRDLNTADPRFVDLSQEQLKLVDDAKVIEDSLYSLAKRVMQIESFITKEVTSMNNYMDGSLQNLKDRKLSLASSQQQYAMTSINNLALMLSDVFKQMQQMMMQMSGSGSKGSDKKGKMPSPGLGEQQKGINGRIENLGKSGMSERQMSEELAKIAQEQARLRKELSRMQDNLNGTPEGQGIGKQLSELQKQMDQSENDLVNKRVDPNLIKRQKLIETRLLEAEKAIKEQELDPTRKSNTGTIINTTPPKSIDDFLKSKYKLNETLRFTPPAYTPFYKSKTDRYFQSIK